MKDGLDRFRIAQQQDFQLALGEIKAGRKASHWMWYIFPQLTGLGRSATAQKYAIKDMKEAREYLADAMLRRNLLEISEALLENESSDAVRVMGRPDDKKLRSSMTLFALADSSCEVFQKVLDKFFDGKMDGRTIQLLKKQASEEAAQK